MAVTLRCPCSSVFKLFCWTTVIYQYGHLARKRDSRRLRISISGWRKFQRTSVVPWWPVRVTQRCYCSDVISSFTAGTWCLWKQEYLQSKNNHFEIQSKLKTGWMYLSNSQCISAYIVVIEFHLNVIIFQSLTFIRMGTSAQKHFQMWSSQTQLCFHIPYQSYTAGSNKKLTEKRKSSTQMLLGQFHIHFTFCCQTASIFKWKGKKKKIPLQMFMTSQLCFNTKSKNEKFKEMTNLTSCWIKWSGAVSNSRRGSSAWSYLLIRRGHHLLDDSVGHIDTQTTATARALNEKALFKTE